MEEDKKNGFIDSELKLFVFGGQVISSLKSKNLSDEVTSASKLKPIAKGVDFKSKEV